MFVVEYRTKCSPGANFPTRLATVGRHHATTPDDAASYLLSKETNIEVVGVKLDPYYLATLSPENAEELVRLYETQEDDSAVTGPSL